MLIGFIGLPSSGKTTISTSMFVNFKTGGTITELLLEEARKYISEKRFKDKLLAGSKIVLSDDEQLEIAHRQFKMEQYFKHSCGPNTIIISDSSIFNTLLYLSKEYFNSELVEKYFFNTMLTHYDLVFYCYPVDNEFMGADPNRIHTKEEIEALGQRAKIVLQRLKDKNVPIEVLLNDQESRVRDACSIALNKHCKVLETSDPKTFNMIMV